MTTKSRKSILFRNDGEWENVCFVSPSIRTQSGINEKIKADKQFTRGFLSFFPMFVFLLVLVSVCRIHFYSRCRRQNFPLFLCGRVNTYNSHMYIMFYVILYPMCSIAFHFSRILPLVCLFAYPRFFSLEISERALQFVSLNSPFFCRFYFLFFCRCCLVCLDDGACDVLS